MIGPMQVEMKEFKRGQHYQVQTDDMMFGRPRYTLNVIDADDQDLLKKAMGVFVVPLGAEREMQVDEFESQKKIRQQTGFSRLVIVVLGRGHKYESLKQIQDELNPKVMDLCPSDCSNRSQIPYLSTNSHLHVRDTVHYDKTLYIEDYIESEVGAEELVVLRQVFFHANPTVVQSEVPLIYRNIKTAKQPIAEEIKASSVLCTPREKRQVIFDRNSLTFEVYHAMLAAMSLADFGNRKLKVLVCGTGAGVFTMFLHHHMSEWIDKLVTVDTNKEFVDLGRKYFGFHDKDNAIESVIGDAHDYVKKGKASSFDLIFMDVCFEEKSEEGVSPPRHFLNQEFIKDLQRMLVPTGVCAINTIIKKAEARKQIFDEINKVADSAKYRSGCQDDLNEVVFLAKGAQQESSSKTRKEQL